jgi:predicted DNA-binding transcriptional regulator AlpA
VEKPQGPEADNLHDFLRQKVRSNERATRTKRKPNGKSTAAKVGQSDGEDEHPRLIKPRAQSAVSLAQLPQEGYVRLTAIIGNPRANPPVVGVFPVSRSHFLNGVKEGIYPAPVKLSPRVTAWSVDSIRELLSRVGK